MQVQFLHGTEMGNAEFLCEDLENSVPEGISAKCNSMEDVDPTDLNGDTLYVFVVSTYGAGDVPNTAQPFYEDLQAAKTDLSHVRFAMFGLGDSNFSDTFNQGSEKVMGLLEECGAKRLGERGLFDASGPEMPEDIAEPWLQGILEMASQST
ncbi:MAG: flavodoxin domain-containing protein [Pseudomonadota bacterium]|nr:flavodoxin domain-containing protein [Pseudomonadota bacterium]